jgi:hypothetical protein
VLTENPIVDPTTAWCLKERVAQEQQEPATRLEYSGDFVDHCLERVNVFESEAQDHGVEPGAAARQRVCSRSRVERATGAVTSDADLRRSRIEPDHLDPGTRDVTGDLSLSASDVEDASRPPEVVGNQWEELLCVFGVGAVGELALPPARMALPEGLTIQGPNHHTGPVRRSSPQKDDDCSQGPWDDAAARDRI